MQSGSHHWSTESYRRATQAEVDRALEELLRLDVNHIDTAARYGDSELRIGPWMACHRKASSGARPTRRWRRCSARRA